MIQSREWMGGGGGAAPRSVSPDQGSDQAVTLADLIGVDEPQIAPLTLHGGAQSALPLQIDHNGVDGALVALGIESHAAHDVGASLGTVLDQGAADGDAGESGEVHRSGVVN